jgi:3-phenylpropionate/cinnamic acid dioxygenase small subunit
MAAAPAAPADPAAPGGAVAAVHALLLRYAECVDRADFDGVGDLFAHATLRSNAGPDAVRGRAAVRDLYAATNRIHEDGTPRTHHLVTNVIVEVSDDGRRAAARSVFVAFQATDALPLQPIVAGRYHDGFELVDGAWRFAERMTHVDLVGDLSQYMAVDLAVPPGAP